MAAALQSGLQSNLRGWAEGKAGDVVLGVRAGLAFTGGSTTGWEESPITYASKFSGAR